MPAFFSKILVISLLSGLFTGNLHAEENEWTYLTKDPQNHLRGYYSDSYPVHNWSLNGSCFNLNSDSFGSDLMTKETFNDFELEFDWKLEAGGNSGVLFAIQPEAMYSYMTGPEIQLLDDARHPDGKTQLTSLGALYGLSVPLLEKKKEALLEGFNRGHLVVKEGRAKFYLNDVLIADHSLGEDLQATIGKSKFKKMKDFYKKSSGHVLFQDHGGKASFCNARIRRL